jgi:AraC family transcriptional regulator of adaptative response/methylated-DNA-[protein]-cysteine methyltransferase
MMHPEDQYHYKMIRRAIGLIDAAQIPLSLEDLAAQMDMSPAHFQKTFSKWAGVSPKKYQQYLSLAQAKSMMQNNHTVIETASAVGMSSPSRLHDLFLSWEAMSPGDYARKGAGLEIFYDWFDTPFGDTLIMSTTRGMCGLGFTSEMNREAVFDDLRARWPNASYVQSTEMTQSYAHASLNGGKAQLHMIGAPFQIKVWEALLAIPSGQVSTYSDIAQAIGNPKAVRAVGTAVGRNPVSWLIPCHRVLRKSGELGGYHWGLPVKRALLAYEAARSETASS